MDGISGPSGEKGIVTDTETPWEGESEEEMIESVADGLRIEPEAWAR